MRVQVKNMSSFASVDKNKLKHPHPPLAESLHWCRPRLPVVVVVYFCRLFVKQDGKHAIISCPRNFRYIRTTSHEVLKKKIIPYKAFKEAGWPKNQPQALS